MKIGVFLNYNAQTVLGREGLGRYLGSLLSGFVDAGHNITIVCPKWSLDTLLDLFQDFQIQEDSIQIITSQKTPAMWGIYNRYMLKGRKKDKRKWRNLFRSANDAFEYILNILFSVTNTAIFIAAIVFAVCLGLALLPFLLLAFLFYFIAKCFNALATRSKVSIKGFFVRLKAFHKQFSKTGQSLNSFLIKRLYEIVTDDLIDKANCENEDVWFIPALFWPEVRRLKGVKVITAPDVVTMSYPLLFAGDDGFADSTRECSETIKDSSYLITYCNYLKEELLIKTFGKVAENVKVIRHPINSMLEYIRIGDDEAMRLNSKKDFTEAAAKAMLYELPSFSRETGEYLNGFKFDNVRYIFYASQTRPHKNILTLIKAYEILLRERHMQIKLFLTCNLQINRKIFDYLFDHRLQFDVISFHGVPAQELAALYKCASLVVNPTLYEGGFPFTFGEGMSVGTPSVMSRIPQVTELTDEYDLECMMFDPYDLNSLADRIEYGIKNREELYRKELPLFNDMMKRTSRDVANEYVEAFGQFIGMNNTYDEDGGEGKTCRLA